MDIYNTIWSVTWIGLEDQNQHKSAQSSQIGGQAGNQGKHTEDVSDVRKEEKKTDVKDSLELPAGDNLINENIVPQEITINTTWETHNEQQTMEQRVQREKRVEKNEIKISKIKNKEKKVG